MWHLAPSIFLQERAEASFPTSCLDTAPSVPSKSKTTQDESCWSGSLTDAYLRFLSGTTLKPFQSAIPTLEATSNGSLSGAIPWLSQVDFPAKTYRSPVKAPALPENDQDSGKNLPGLLAKYDPATHSLKTAQLSLLEDSMSSSVTLPRSGWMRSGRLYPQPRLVLPIEESASGYWRTPTVGMLNADRAKDPEYANRKRAKGQTITLADQVKWPTPTQSDGTGGPGNSGREGGMNLRTAVALWPTPTVCGNYNRKGASATSGDGLATAVKQFPTPTTRDHKGGANWANRQRDGKPRPVGDMTLPDVVEAQGGSLNPVWVCWLQGFPLNWFQAGGISSPMSDESLLASKTASVNSKPLAIPKYPSKPPSPGES